MNPDGNGRTERPPQTRDLERHNGSVSTKTPRTDTGAALPIEEIISLADSGQEAATRTEETIEGIAITASEVRSQITELEETVEQIEAIVSLIDEIAERTNILALNASIEAAHAEDGGDGFAVVANEVKQLAERAHDQTEEIESQVESIGTHAERSAESLEELNHKISEGIGTSQTAVTSFEGIRNQLDDAMDLSIDGSDGNPNETTSS